MDTTTSAMRQLGANSPHVEQSGIVGKPLFGRKDRQMLPIYSPHRPTRIVTGRGNTTVLGHAIRRVQPSQRKGVVMTLSLTPAQTFVMTGTLRVSLVSVIAVLISAGGAWVAPPPAHACTCTTSGTTGIGGHDTQKSGDPGKSPTSTATGGSGGSDSSSGTGIGSIGGPSTTGTTDGPDDTVDYGGFAGGTGGSGTPLHVTSAARLPESTGVWSSGGWALGGMLRGPELPSWGPWIEAPPCSGSNPPCMSLTVQTNGGSTKTDGTSGHDDPIPDPASTASTASTASSGGDGDGDGDGGGTAVTIPTAVGPDVTDPAAGPVEVPRPPVEPLADLAPSTRDVAVVLMSGVGTGFSAVIIILILLTIGIWYFGHRVAVQLATVEKRNA